MSRFHTATIFLVLTALAAWFGLEGPLCWLAVGILLAVYLVIFALGVSLLRLNFFVKAACRGEATAGRAALTFDDGPDPATTTELLFEKPC